MLEPQDRRLFLEALRPTEGFALSGAIGTTYSLDLFSLLLAPVGFSLFDLDEKEGRPEAGAPVLLEALRRHSEKIALFCQAGEVRASAAGHPLLAYLEGSVVEVDPGTGGVFHPKVWLLRFESEGREVRYRLLVASRNLTFDRSWDTLVALEGPLTDRQKAYARNHPIGDFVAALPKLATRRPVAERFVRMARQMADEVRRVDFQVPEPFEECGFWAGGLEGSRWPFPDRRDRALVVSPFLAGSTLARLAGDGENVVVSTDLALRGVEPKVLRTFGGARVLTDAVEPEETEESAGTDELSGLHAKVYVFDQGWSASVWTGSANATEAAFTTNVEFLVNLRGKRSLCGVDSMLGLREGATTFGALLVGYEPPEAWVAPEQDLAEKRLDAARRSIALAGLRAEAGPLDEKGELSVRLAMKGDPGLPAGVAVRCRPISTTAAFGQPLPAAGAWVEFGPFGIDGLTSFFAFDVTTATPDGERSCRFVVNVPLDGAPADRSQRIVRHILRDGAAVVRFILLMLSLDSDVPGDEGAGALGGERWRVGAFGGNAAGLFEQIVRAVHRTPERLDALAAIIGDLRSGPDAAERLPEGLLDLWDAAVAAREALRP